jgi:hypothetical protein
MKKKLLVVGDSFMRPDPDFPGQHWSEMLPEYDVIMNSQAGASNGIIALRLYQGLEQNPDAVVIGFSFPSRIEFRVDSIWTTGSDKVNTSKDQQLLADLYQIHTDETMCMIKECSIARGMLSLLNDKRIPFAWTLNGLFDNISRLPYPSDPWVNTLLSDYFDRMTLTNLSTYPAYKKSPGFHTDNPVWQQRFAQEVSEIVKTPIDFSQQIK